MSRRPTIVAPVCWAVACAVGLAGYALSLLLYNRAVVDLSGRPFVVWAVELPEAIPLGTPPFDPSLAEHAITSFAVAAAIEELNAAGGVLAKTPNPPTYNKVNPADTPIMTLAITSGSLPLDKVNDYADSLLGQKLSQVTGVGLVSIQGNQKPAVRVQGEDGPAEVFDVRLGLRMLIQVFERLDDALVVASLQRQHQSKSSPYIKNVSSSQPILSNTDLRININAPAKISTS